MEYQGKRPIWGASRATRVSGFTARFAWATNAESREVGFRTGEYRLVESGVDPRAVLARSGAVGGGRLEIVKEVALRGGKLEAAYALANAGGEPLAFTFAVELNLGPDFAVPAGGAPRGPEVSFWEPAGALVMACPPAGLVARLAAPGAAAAAWQVKTVSQSETSYEICVQGLALVAWWYLNLAPGARVEKTLTLSVGPA